MRPIPLAEVRPPGSDGDALDRVRRRVGVLRRRRRVGTAVALTVLVVLGGTWAWRGDAGRDRLQVTASPTTTAAAQLGAVDWDALAYPIDCGAAGARVLQVAMVRPDDAHQVAVVLVACDAGAGSPPRSILVYDSARSTAAPRLHQTLAQDGQHRITASLSADGPTLTATGGTYSSASIPRCCPDGEFTTRWRWNGTEYTAT